MLKRVAQPDEAEHQGKDSDSVKTIGNLFLVREGDLCHPCLERCRRKKLFEGSRKKNNFSGLISPNSVDRGNQENWRQQTTISPPSFQKGQARPAGDTNTLSFMNNLYE